ncbi:unnamed protein product [Fusarium venenatum]|uniref:Uncharacterized protein n=1 Tax=Fusarium venenatum TaxID=56646 RepID=A0A2L2SQS6_9HYPO|nr:uncharacterized protein FVRRES_12031 [Fusarium venenatum]CEI39340.1 unnamed protein product [Fusarium venenatum]
MKPATTDYIGIRDTFDIKYTISQRELGLHNTPLSSSLDSRWLENF